jgi:hypothetical protein
MRETFVGTWGICRKIWGVEIFGGMFGKNSLGKIWVCRNFWGAEIFFTCVPILGDVLHRNYKSQRVSVNLQQILCQVYGNDTSTTSHTTQVETLNVSSHLVFIDHLFIVTICIYW